MVQAQEQLLTTIEGPEGMAEIYEVVLSAARFEIVYKVLFRDLEASFPSMGEAHIKANELVGLQDSEPD